MSRYISKEEERINRRNRRLSKILEKKAKNKPEWVCPIVFFYIFIIIIFIQEVK